MLHDAIKRTGLHQVELLSHIEFSANTKKSQETCNTKQLIVIEGSIEIDLLYTVNYWKSRGKTVVVDIPLTSEFKLNNHLSTNDPSFSLSNLYANISNNTITSVTPWDKFKWGVHLANAILVSSPNQVDHWQSTAPVKVVQEYIDLDTLRNLSKTKNSELVIGLFTNCAMINSDFSRVHKDLVSIDRHFHWLPFNVNDKISVDAIQGYQFSLPEGFPKKWPNPLSLVDVAVFWNFEAPYPGFYRNVLELMALRTPWFSCTTKSSHEILKHGIITSTSYDLSLHLQQAVSKGIIHSNDSLEAAYFVALGYNIDDHIHNILSIFNEIQKSSN